MAGKVDSSTDLPVGSLREAIPFLRRPFTENAVKFKVQATWSGGGLIVSYIDARLVGERLNLVIPALWHDEYEPLGSSLICKLTIDGVTRQDIGAGYQGKGLYSDAFKRAGVKFGVGVSLYAMPQMRLNVNDGHLKVQQTKNGDKTILTPNGETHSRTIYANWLETIGIQAFGEPLDHGDVVDAIGSAIEDDEGGDLPAAPTPDEDAAVRELEELYTTVCPERSENRKKFGKGVFGAQLRAADTAEKRAGLKKKLEEMRP